MRGALVVLTVLLGGALAACGESADNPGNGGRIDAGPPGCVPTSPDSDGDTLTDKQEGSGQAIDTDEDFMPDYLDLDSDADGITDHIEAGDDNPCTDPPDTDGNGVADFRQFDASCPGSYISGFVSAPNGLDPVPAAVVYVPAGDIDEFPESVSCELCTQLTGRSLVSTYTSPDGSFVLGPIPLDVQASGLVKLVVQKGRFRRIVEVPITNPCGENEISPRFFQLPSKTDGLNHVPKIAVATGNWDAIECVLLKLGLDASAVDVYDGQSFSESDLVPFGDLLADPEKMKTYELIFINCTGNTFEDLLADEAIRANIEGYVASGGRLYATDWSYDYIEQIPAWSPVIDFGPTNSGDEPEAENDAAIGGTAPTQAAVHDPALAEWMRAVEARTGDKDIITEDEHVPMGEFLGGWVVQWRVPASPTTTVWLDAEVEYPFDVFDTRPLTTTFDYNECGRVLYSSYHTRVPEGHFPAFPAYCEGNDLSAQERVLEYLILHLADCLDPEG